MRRKRVAKFIFFFCSFVILALTVVMMVRLLRDWEREVEIENQTFTESARELKNPNRGFYRLYSFLITDEAQNYPQMISSFYPQDKKTKLALIQICLKTYRQGAISEEGLSNIEALFDALEGLDKQLIVRFTYDNEGENEKYEPESLDIILNHMQQLSNILHEYSEEIFSLQGLFIGNWGEMNGTKYSSDGDLRRLAKKLADVTSPSTYLAVRSPAQWRSIMYSGTSGSSMEDRLGLFNDGMLGSESDYGTYRTGENADDGLAFPRLERKEELEFQNELCREVPNGGEVINDNVYNDWDEAVEDLEVMHVTYLNRAYDQEVLDKWADTVVTEDSCFEGMDGLSYVERHLGYRFTIADTRLYYKSREETLTAKVTLKNVGFAPIYKEAEARITLYDEKKDQAFVYPVNHDLQTLSGGSEKKDKLTLSVEIPFSEFLGKKYSVYFSIIDSSTGEIISLANEENEEQYGYCIGKLTQ